MGLMARLRKRVRVYQWRLRFWWLDTPAGSTAQTVTCCLAALVVIMQMVRMAVAALAPPDPDEPILAYWWIVQLVVMIVAAVLVYANRPKPEMPKPSAGKAPTVEDGQSIKHHLGTVWVEDEFFLAWRVTGTVPIKSKGGKK